MYRIILASLFIGLFISCSTINTATKGIYLQRLQRVTPKDIKDHTQKILVNEYQYQIEDSNIGTSSIYYETSWKNVDMTKDEKKKGWSDVRVRFKIRSRETRSGPTNTYTVHSLKFTGEVEAYKQLNGSSRWVMAEITPQRKDYLETIYSDFKLEFNTGSMDFN